MGPRPGRPAARAEIPWTGQPGGGNVEGQDLGGDGMRFRAGVATGILLGLSMTGCTGGGSPVTSTTGLEPTTSAPPTTSVPSTVTTSLPADGVVMLGDPPWRLPPLDPESIEAVYFLEWRGEAGAPPSCPLLVFAEVGEQASGAVIRRALNEGEMLVAWDRPSGPGHDGMSNPCEDCGRGAFGLGTWQSAVFEDRPVTRAWTDGSRARTFPGTYGIEAFLEVEGFGCTYWLWSHLGEDHLDLLLSRLRRVAGAP